MGVVTWDGMGWDGMGWDGMDDIGAKGGGEEDPGFCSGFQVAVVKGFL